MLYLAISSTNPLLMKQLVFIFFINFLILVNINISHLNHLINFLDTNLGPSSPIITKLMSISDILPKNRLLLNTVSMEQHMKEGLWEYALYRTRRIFPILKNTRKNNLVKTGLSQGEFHRETVSLYLACL